MILPNFFLVGAPKAGTTSLYDYFRAHPEIFMPAVKGARFFCYDGQQDPLKFRYHTLEDYAAIYAAATTETAIGDATAVYFEHPEVAGRIREVVPGARIIAVLREPVQRAFSIYHMNLRDRGRNHGLGFLAALGRDEGLRKLYFDGLAPFFREFPRERIRILRFDDLRDDTAGTVRSLYEFLGVRPDFVPDLSVSNPGGVPRSRRLHHLLNNPRLREFARTHLPERLVKGGKDLRSRNLEKHVMTPEERDRGYAWFHDDLLRTQELTGLDLSAWIRS